MNQRNEMVGGEAAERENACPRNRRKYTCEISILIDVASGEVRRHLNN
jgi:hypothetical protein